VPTSQSSRQPAAQKHALHQTHLLELLHCCRSYGARTETSGSVQVSFDAEAVAGRHCIMVDDLCDSGLTLLTVRAGSVNVIPTSQLPNCPLHQQHQQWQQST
jgi:hypoxanthine-guanine phosphoribosyltransferase